MQQAVAQLPRGRVTVLVTLLSDATKRLVRSPGGRAWLVACRPGEPDRKVDQRIGAASSDLLDHLMPTDSECARRLVRDPHVLEHPGPGGRNQERDVERGFMGKLQVILLRCGHRKAAE